MFVYLITNTIDGKRYVGQTITSLDRRWKSHQKLKSCRYLHSAIQKYGKENFIIEAICEPPTVELMNEFEAEYIRLYNTLVPNGYNLTEGGRVPRHNKDTRKKMSESHKGRRPPASFKEAWTQEMKKAASERLTSRWKDVTFRSKATVLGGSDNPNASLNVEQVAKIRELWFSGNYTQTEIAPMFSIDQTTVSKIVLNQTYK